MFYTHLFNNLEHEHVDDVVIYSITMVGYHVNEVGGTTNILNDGFLFQLKPRPSMVLKYFLKPRHISWTQEIIFVASNTSMLSKQTDVGSWHLYEICCSEYHDKNMFSLSTCI